MTMARLTLGHGKNINFSLGNVKWWTLNGWFLPSNNDPHYVVHKIKN